MSQRKERKTVMNAKKQELLKQRESMRHAMYLMQFCPLLVRLRLAHHVLWKTDIRKALRMQKKAAKSK